MTDLLSVFWGGGFAPGGYTEMPGDKTPFLLSLSFSKPLHLSLFSLYLSLSVFPSLSTSPSLSLSLCFYLSSLSLFPLSLPFSLPFSLCLPLFLSVMFFLSDQLTAVSLSLRLCPELSFLPSHHALQ